MTRGNPSPTDHLVDALVASYLDPSGDLESVAGYELPSIDEVARSLEQCRALIIPGYAGSSVARLTDAELRERVRERIVELETLLHRQVYRALYHVKGRRAPQPSAAGAGRGANCVDCTAGADQIVPAFLHRLPALRGLLQSDVRAAFEGDPAATGIDEVMFSYPGIYATLVYRIANALLAAGAPMIPRMMTELAHQRTGIDIHPGARIAGSFFIDHGTGVVIGETTIIGERVRIYQGVTLGALTVPRAIARPLPGGKRHPTIEDDVVIYAGATILGGDTTIGRGAVIGGNAWVTSSVAPGTRVGGTVGPSPGSPSLP